MAEANPIAFHTDHAAGWDARYQSGGFKKRADFFRAEILPLLPDVGLWLDAGCGSGYFSRLIARPREVIGIDGSGAMIEAATALAETEGLNRIVRFRRVEDLERLAFDANSFNGCLCLSVVEYLQKPTELLQELARVVVPGGTVVVSVPNARSLVRWAQQQRRTIGGRSSGYLDHSRACFTEAAIQQLLVNVGFTNIRVKQFDPVIPSMLQGILPGSLIFAVAERPNEPAATD